MKPNKKVEHDFIIDRLTNSVLNTISGDSFPTEVSILTKSDLKNITKKNGWNFDWRVEFKNEESEQYKLTIVNNPNIIQGLLSITIETDHIFMNLLESAPFNIGQNKLYEGVAGNLVAYACKLSFQKGLMALFHLQPKHNSLNITKKRWGHFISKIKEWLLIPRHQKS